MLVCKLETQEYHTSVRRGSNEVTHAFAAAEVRNAGAPVEDIAECLTGNARGHVCSYSSEDKGSSRTEALNHPLFERFASHVSGRIGENIIDHLPNLVEFTHAPSIHLTMWRAPSAAISRRDQGDFAEAPLLLHQLPPLLQIVPKALFIYPVPLTAVRAL